MTDPITQSMIQGAAGAGGDKVYVDDLFSVDMWAGDNNTRTIDNGLDLAGEGGIVFIKGTDVASDWVVSGTGFGDTNNMCTNNNNGIIDNNEDIRKNSWFIDLISFVDFISIEVANKI